jgi:hypothetical protein
MSATFAPNKLIQGVTSIRHASAPSPKDEATGQADPKDRLGFWSAAPKYCHMVQGKRFLRLVAFHPANPHPIPLSLRDIPLSVPAGGDMSSQPSEECIFLNL